MWEVFSLRSAGGNETAKCMGASVQVVGLGRRPTCKSCACPPVQRNHAYFGFVSGVLDCVLGLCVPMSP